MGKSMPKVSFLPVSSERVLEFSRLLQSSILQAARCRSNFSASHTLHCYWDGYEDALLFVKSLISPHVPESDSDSDLPF